VHSDITTNGDLAALVAVLDALAIAGRLGKLEDLLERPPADLVAATDCSFRGPVNEHLAPDLCPQMHVGAHPSPVSLAVPARGVSGRADERTGMSGAVVFDDHKPVTSAVVFDDRSHL
jgi:hypothetical protein